jgi:excisionase family DNA binding protein
MPKPTDHARATDAPLPQFHPALRYTVEEASALLRQGRSTTFGQIKAGVIRVLRVGERTYVPGSEIERLSRLPGEAA